VRPLDRSRDDLASTPPNSDTGFDPSANVRENLPTLSSLTASGAVSLPDLRLDIHVYSGRPADRFVFVNMRKYLEGQTLSEGPTIERITADGVVLNNQGVRLLLPRQ
jgi:general secretion pathway protein B